MNPSSGHNTVESASATFTLTNVIPQVNSFNQQCWKFFEQAIFKHVNRQQKYHQNICVVGAVPGFNVTLNDRVNVPSYMWSTVQSESKVIAVLVPNVPNDEIKENKSMRLFWFSESKLPGFNTDIKTLYSAISKYELTKMVATLEAKPEYFENNVNFLARKQLRKCLAPYHVKSFAQVCWRYFKQVAVQYVTKMNCSHNNVITEGVIHGFQKSEHTDLLIPPSYIWATVACNGTVVASLVPNVYNNQTEENKWMTLFYFSESKLPSFDEEIKSLNNTSNDGKLKVDVEKLKSESKYFESNPPEIFFKDKELNPCLAAYRPKDNNIQMFTSNTYTTKTEQHKDNNIQMFTLNTYTTKTEQHKDNNIQTFTSNTDTSNTEQQSVKGDHVSTHIPEKKEL